MTGTDYSLTAAGGSVYAWPDTERPGYHLTNVRDTRGGFLSVREHESRLRIYDDLGTLYCEAENWAGVALFLVAVVEGS